MKIKKLWVSKYKNLENLTFEFKEGKLMSLLVGQNGFGKSNLIEVLAIIFKSLFQHDSLKNAQEWSSLNNMLEYEIDYVCKGRNFRVICSYLNFEISFIDEHSPSIITFTDFKRNRKNYLPDFILGYYSGNSPRLRNLIDEVEKIEKDKLKRDQKSQGKLNPPLRSLIITRDHHAQLILFTLILFMKESRYSKFIEILLKKYVGVSTVHELFIEFNNPDWQFENIGNVNYSMDYLFSNLQEGQDFPFWHLKGKINDMFHYLNNNNVSDPLYFVAEGSEKISELKEGVKELLQFDHLNLDKMLQDIKEGYETPKDLFESIDACEILDIIHRIKTDVSKSGEKSIDFNNLSEGEQQLITTIGLIIIFSEYDTLFLFDEPDTHLNPKWQREYISIIKEFMPPSHAANSHLVVATHSPLLVQAADENSDLFLFRKSDENQKIVVDYQDTRIPNWRVDHVLLSKYFDLDSTRPKSLDSYMKERNELLQKVKLTKEDLKKLQSLADDFEQLPTGETLTDLKVLRKAYEHFKDEKSK